MTTPPTPDKTPRKPPDDRHLFGPRPLSKLIPAAARPVFQRRAPGIATLLADWNIIIGPKLAPITTPRKLQGGTLTLACNGPVAMELQYLSDIVIARLNTHLGGTPIQRLRFVPDTTAPPPASPPKRIPAIEAARAAVADIADEGLRDALERLGRMVLAEKPPR